MQKLLIATLLFSCSLLSGQKSLVVLPVKVEISAEMQTEPSTSTAKVGQDSLFAMVETLTADFQEYTDEVLRELEMAYGEGVLFLGSSDELPDSLDLKYSQFTNSIDQAFYRNQRKEDDGPFTAFLSKKGDSNKVLKEKNEKNLLEASKPFAQYFGAKVFLSVEVIGMQSAPLKNEGIYGGMRVQVLITEASTGATVFFKTHSRGTMRTMMWDGKYAHLPPSAASVHKARFQARLKSMLKAGLNKAS